MNNEAVVTDCTDPSYDKIAKVRWLVEAFVATSQSQYNNERVCTVDEMMIPYKGRYCNIQQYMKAKPIQFRIKVWALAKLQSRFVSTSTSIPCTSSIPQFTFPLSINFGL